MDISRSDKLLAGVALVLLVLPGAAFWSRLPDPLATHWGPGGSPDGHLTKLGWLLFSVFLWGLMWSMYLAVRHKAPSTWKSPFTFGLIGGLAFAQASITEANLDAPSWTAADHLDGSFVVIAFFVAWVAFGLITYAVERR